MTLSHNQRLAEAVDLAQETFVRVYFAIERYHTEYAFSTYIYRIATNLAVNHARDTRHERPENMVSLDEPDEETGTTMDVADGSLTVEQTILRRERMAAIPASCPCRQERSRGLS